MPWIAFSLVFLIVAICSAEERLRSRKGTERDNTRRKVASRPASVDEANAGFAERQVISIKTWIANRDIVGARPSGVDRPLHDIKAGLFAFANPDLFDEEDFARLSYLPEGSVFDQHKDVFFRNISDYMSSIEIFETIGTDFGDFDTPGIGKFGPDGTTQIFGGDWDFYLTFLIPILYQFIDRTDVLSNDMRWDLLRQGTVEGEIPYSGNSLSYLEVNLFVYKFSPIAKFRVRMTETENHILQIYTWKYLVNNYVRYIAQLDPSDDRYDPRVADLYANNPEHYTNSPELVDLMLQMTGIILHKDLFETNSKPYEAYSAISLLILHSYVDTLFPDDENNQKIKLAAQNALDLLAVKFTFQTFEGKRIAPMRRNWGSKKVMGFYESDYIPMMFAMLSGVNFFQVQSDVFDYRREGVIMQTALLDYRLPVEIHDYMLDRYDGFWARMQSLYYSDHFYLSYNTSFLTSRDPPEPYPTPAKFFESDGKPANSGVFRPLPQVYFGTNDYLNSAGGCGLNYFAIEGPLRFLPFEIKTLADLRAIAKPNVVLNGADYSFYGDNITQLEDDFLTMRGEMDPAISKNLNTYKSFTFGYLRGESRMDRYMEWPMTVPSTWGEALVREFSLNRAHFRVYDFSSSAEMHPMYGYYVITSRVSKFPIGRDFRRVARGFWEIVPARMFESADELATFVQQHNPGSFFSGNVLHPYKYVLATTGEKIKIDQRAGGFGVNMCSAFRAIWSPDGKRQDLEAYHFDTRRLKKMEDVGILDVWEVDSNYMFGEKIAGATGDGRLFVKNEHVGSTLLIDGSDYNKPRRQIVST